MSNVMVYVFLLDSLAGFRNALNESVIHNTPSSHGNYTPILRECDSTIANQILVAVTKELEAEILPTKRTDETFAFSVEDALNHATQDALYGALLASSLNAADAKDEIFVESGELYDFDASQNTRRHLNVENEEALQDVVEAEGSDKVTKSTAEYKEKIETTKNYTKEDVHIQNVIDFVEQDRGNDNSNDIDVEKPHQEIANNGTEEGTDTMSMDVDFPKSAPFLVAIFETLANVTAQTCAGTLIAPDWVLTSANCVNILSNLYTNDTNMTDSETLYTVVAGASDPLLDGSAHNVTAVLQHERSPENSTRHRKSVHVKIGPCLAMMKIEPAFEGVGLPLMEKKVNKGEYVTVYGWILIKNESGFDNLNLVIMSALILSTAECQAMYSFNNKDVICLFNNNRDINITQLSSGGPVLVLHDGEVKLLAVAQTDEEVLIAYPLYVHYHWIKDILNSTF